MKSVLALPILLLLATSLPAQKDESRLPFTWWNDVPEMIRRGNDLYGSGDFKEAEEFYQGAKLKSPDEAIAAFNLGLARARQGEYDAAADAFTNAINLAPHNPELQSDAYYNKGLSSLASGLESKSQEKTMKKTIDSIDAFDQALSLRNGDFDSARKNKTAAQHLLGAIAQGTQPGDGDQQSQSGGEGESDQQGQQQQPQSGEQQQPQSGQEGEGQQQQPQQGQLSPEDEQLREQLENVRRQPESSDTMRSEAQELQNRIPEMSEEQKQELGQEAQEFLDQPDQQAGQELQQKMEEILDELEQQRQEEQEQQDQQEQESEQEPQNGEGQQGGQQQEAEPLTPEQARQLLNLLGEPAVIQHRMGGGNRPKPEKDW